MKLYLNQFKVSVGITCLMMMSQVSFSQNCNETSFPNLGPSASSTQTCTDVSNPLNTGTLDCRTDVGGYSQQSATVNGGSVTYGVYTIKGSTRRYDGTKTRVERSFNDVDRGVNKSTKFTAKFVIDDLSDGNTCIVQAHATGRIVAGEKTGQTARSAVFLLYAKKTSNANIYELEVHESTTPYTTTTGGGRTRTFFRNVTKGEEYTMEYTTGYDVNRNAFSIIKVFKNSADSETTTLNHTYTTESVYTRYGAYGANDTNDQTAKLKFRNTSFCRLTTAVNENEAPEVSISSPVDNQVYELGDEITFSANATDTDGNLDKVNFKINNVFYRTDNSRPFQTTFTPVEPGTYKIGARAFDLDNAQKEVFVTITVVERNEAPVASFSTPSTTSLEEGYPELVVTVDAFDPNGDDISVLLKINGDEVRSESIAPYEWGHEGSPNSLETMGLMEGEHVLEAVVTDSKGASTSIMKTITITERVVTSTVSKFDEKNSLTVFPNPSESGVFSLSYPTDYEVHNIRSEVVLEGAGDIVDLSSFPKGVYLVKVNQKVVQIVR